MRKSSLGRAGQATERVLGFSADTQLHFVISRAPSLDAITSGLSERISPGFPFLVFAAGDSCSAHQTKQRALPTSKKAPG